MLGSWYKSRWRLNYRLDKRGAKARGKQTGQGGKWGQSKFRPVEKPQSWQAPRIPTFGKMPEQWTATFIRKTVQSHSPDLAQKGLEIAIGSTAGRQVSTMTVYTNHQRTNANRNISAGLHLISLLHSDNKSVQSSSAAQSCLTLCHCMNRSMPGLPVHHQLPEFTQTHAHRVGDAIQPPHPLPSHSLPDPNPSQHQGLFQWVNSSHELVEVLEFEL